MTASRNRRSPMLRLLCLGIAQCLYAAPVLAQSAGDDQYVDAQIRA